MPIVGERLQLCGVRLAASGSANGQRCGTGNPKGIDSEWAESPENRPALRAAVGNSDTANPASSAPPPVRMRRTAHTLVHRTSRRLAEIIPAPTSVGNVAHT